MTNYVIKLASNFQTIEFNLEIPEDECLSMQDDRILAAVHIVNELGQVVENSIKTKEPVKVEIEPATPGQIKFLKNFKIDGTKMTKQEAYAKLKELTKN